MEGPILRLLERHGSLGFVHITTLLDGRPDEVRLELDELREDGLIGALALGEAEVYTVHPASYWRLTDEGRRRLQEVAA